MKSVFFTLWRSDPTATKTEWETPINCSGSWTQNVSDAFLYFDGSKVTWI